MCVLLLLNGTTFKINLTGDQLFSGGEVQLRTPCIAESQSADGFERKIEYNFRSFLFAPSDKALKFQGSFPITLVRRMQLMCCVDLVLNIWTGCNVWHDHVRH